MSKRKIKFKLPRSRQKITVDKSGRIRVGGRFVSKRQFGAIKAARTRAGLPTVVPKGPSKKSAAKARSKSAKKAARTRKAKSSGATFVSERITARQKFRYISYRIDPVSLESIRAAIDLVIFNRKTEVLVYPVISVIDKRGDDFKISTSKGFFRDAKSKDTADQLMEDIANLTIKYEFRAIESVDLVFTFGL